MPLLSSLFKSDLDIPIVIRKGVRTCTKHPLSNFVSYHRLSPSYKAFITNLILESIPYNIQEALRDPQWRKAIFMKMRSLYKTKTWEVVELLCVKKKKQLAPNGYLPLNTRQMVQLET